MVLSGTLEDADRPGTIGSGGCVRAAESIGAAGTATGGGLRGGGGAVLPGDGATTCEGLGGGGGGALSGIATLGLVADVTGGEGFRIGTAGIGRDMGEAGVTGDRVRGRGGVAGGLSPRIAGGARRGGRGAELAPISFFREGRLGTGRTTGVGPLVGSLGGGTEGLAGTGAGGFGGGTLRAGVGAAEPSDLGMDGGFPRIGGIASRQKLQNWLLVEQFK